MVNRKRKMIRYERRKRIRAMKRRKHFAKYDNVNNLTSLSKLHKSAKQCCKGVYWKTSTQRYDYNRLMYITRAREDILAHKDITKGFVCFTLVERGKARKIKAVRMEERVVQKTLCREVLIPALQHYLIVDNGACIKGKGTDYAIKRTTKHLVDYYRANKTNKGYIFQFDFKSYFDSIPLDKLCELMIKDFKDEYVVDIIKQVILTFKKYGDNGIGLGSEVSQICAVYYLNKFDHIIKDKLGIKQYNRYMDDGYTIHTTKREAQKVKKILTEYIKSLGIKFNENKTQIKKLEHGFSFLKMKFYLQPNGRVDKKANPQRFTRERRKLKKFKIMVDNGEMSIDDVCNQVQSVVRSMKHCKNYHAKLNLQKLFNELFKDYHRRLKINGKIIKD